MPGAIAVGIARLGATLALIEGEGVWDGETIGHPLRHQVP
jgi:hypothetical protein